MDRVSDAPGNQRSKILIVEDDPAVRRAMQLLLHAQGFAVRTHATGPAVLADAEREPPDCLVADYLLAGTNGIDILKTLRGQGWDGPAVLVSAFASESLKARALAAGFTQVFEKPLRERALVEVVARLVRRPSIA